MLTRQTVNQPPNNVKHKVNDYHSAFVRLLDAVLDAAKQSGKSAASVAREAGLSPAYLSQARNGKATTPTRDVLLRIAQAIGTDPRPLLAAAALARGAVELPELDDEVKLARLARRMVDLAEDESDG